MGPSKLEVNIRRLLLQCELLAKENSQADWRLEKFIKALDDMIQELCGSPNEPDSDVLSDYVRRMEFLKSLIKTQNLATPSEKVIAAQQLKPGPSSSEHLLKEIAQKKTSQYTRELRSELFSANLDGTRQRKSQDTMQGDVDAILKHQHQMQERIAEEMLSLTRDLKEQTQLANTIIRNDTEVIKKSLDMTDRNYDQLKKESVRLEEYGRRAWRCWLWVAMAIVFIVFINMVLFMKVTWKKPGR